MCSSPGGGNNAPQFAGTTELEDSGAVWCNGAVVLNLFFWLVTECAIVCKLFLLPCPSSQYTMWRQFSCPLLAPGCFGCCNGWCCLGFPLLQAGKPSAHCAG